MKLFYNPFISTTKYYNKITNGYCSMAMPWSRSWAWRIRYSLPFHQGCHVVYINLSSCGAKVHSAQAQNLQSPSNCPTFYYVPSIFAVSMLEKGRLSTDEFYIFLVSSGKWNKKAYKLIIRVYDQNQQHKHETKLPVPKCHFNSGVVRTFLWGLARLEIFR